MRVVMDMHRVTDTTGEPNTWKLKHFAHIGGNEEFVAQLMIEMPELVDASMIYGEERDKLKEAILLVSVKGLMPAFEHLKEIRASSGRKMPELNRKQLFQNFEGALWRAHKDLMQKAAKMMEPGIGFLFQKDRQFEAGLVVWGEKRPKLALAVAPYLRKQRIEWQNDLADFRNYIEHDDDRDPAAFDSRYDLVHSERLFESVWRAIADVLAMLVSLHLPPGTSLEEIPPEERDPVRPRRFRYAVSGVTRPLAAAEPISAP